MATFQHILVPTDFGAAADHALDTALELAGKFDSRVTLLHAFMIPVAGYDQALVWPFEAHEREAQRALDGALQAARPRWSKIEGVLLGGCAWELIVEYAKTGRVSLVCMGTHNRGGLGRVLLGSHADKVVRLSPIPVLTVGARDDLPPRPVV
jgi:nucleotide-binding universal stress UspA family protein